MKHLVLLGALLLPSVALGQDAEPATPSMPLDPTWLKDPNVNRGMGIPSEQWPSIYDILSHPTFEGGRAAIDMFSGAVANAYGDGIAIAEGTLAPHRVRVTFDFPSWVTKSAYWAGKAGPYASVATWWMQKSDPDIEVEELAFETICTGVDVALAYLRPTMPMAAGLLSATCATIKTVAWSIKQTQGLDAEIVEGFLMSGAGRDWLGGTGVDILQADPSALTPFVDDFIANFIDAGTAERAPAFRGAWLRYMARSDTYGVDVQHIERTLPACIATYVDADWKTAAKVDDRTWERRDCYSSKLRSAVAAFLRQEYMRAAKPQIEAKARAAATPEGIAQMVLASNLARVATHFPNMGLSVQKVLNAIAAERAGDAAAAKKKAEEAREKQLADLQRRRWDQRKAREKDLASRPAPRSTPPTPGVSDSAPTGGPLPAAPGWHWWTDPGADVALRFPDSWRTGDPNVYAPSFCADSARLTLTRGGSAGGTEEHTNGFTWLNDDPGATERRVTIRGPGGTVLGTVTSRSWREYSESSSKAACKDQLARMASQPFPATGDGLAQHNRTKATRLFTIHNATTTRIELHGWLEDPNDYAPDDVPLGIALGPGQKIAVSAGKLEAIDANQPIKAGYDGDAGYLMIGGGNSGLRARGPGVCRLKDSYDYDSGSTWTIQWGSDGGCN